MQYINIVHLSDLHLQTEGVPGFNQRRILDALTKDLEQLSEGEFRPDVLVFSGDVVAAGDDDAYDDASNVLDQIISAANLTREHALVVPGNHDARQSQALKDRHLLSEIDARITNPNDCNGLFFDQRLIQHVGQKFSGFTQFQAKFGPKPTKADAFATLYEFPHLATAFVAINTAVLSTAGHKDLRRDQGHLAFPELAIADAVSLAKDASAKILVGHHPLLMMSEACTGALNTLICKEADAYLFGHMHVSDPTNLQSAVGECKFIQSGALYMGRGRWNGYCIISIVPGEAIIRIVARKYHDVRLEFGVASDLNDAGTIFFPTGTEKRWAEIPKRPNLAKLEQWRVEVLIPSLVKECRQSLTTHPLSSVYVEPEFERDVFVDTAAGRELRNIPDVVSFSEAMAEHGNIIVAAAPESGKTALIRHWAEELSNLNARTPGWSIPVILQFANVKSYFGGVESAIKRRLTSLPEGIQASDLLKTGLVTVFVDDMKLEESKEKQAISEFIRAYPQCRFILVTSTLFIQGAGIAPAVAVGAEFQTLRIKKLRNSQLLELIEKHGTQDPKAADRILNRMVLEANALSVPITPVSGTFLIQIYTEDASKPLINRANLIERYVEISLEKFASDEFLRGTFDFHNKADLLSDISEKMCRTESYEWNELDTLRAIKDYLDRYGLNYRPIELLEYFVDARVLERLDDRIAFRLRAFMEYFAARRMNTDTEFRDYVLAEERYLSFPNEISFYAAVSRRDVHWLNELHSRFKRHSEDVWRNVPEEVRSGTLLEHFKLPSSDATEAEVLAVERRILDADLTEEGRKELLRHEASAEPESKRVHRPKLEDPGDAWIEEIGILSSMLKNMELVPNEKKREILEDVLTGWLRFICLSLGMVPALAKERTITLSGVKYEVHFPEGMEIGEIARRLFIHMPVSVLRLMVQCLGTEKLQLQLEEGLGEDLDKVSGGRQLLRAGLLALLGCDSASDKLAIVGKRFRDRRYLSEVLLRQLYELAIRYRLPDHELKKIRGLAADLTTRLESTPTAKVGKRKSEIIKSLTRSRLVVRVDPSRSDEIKPLPAR